VLGSCAFVTAQENGDLAFAIASGTGVITSAGTTRIVTPGWQVRIPLGGEDGLQVNGEPSELEPFDYDAIRIAPLLLAGCPGEVPPPEGSVIPTPVVSTPVSGGGTPGCQRPDWTFTYVVPFGDTLSRIASSIGISLSELAQGNGITNMNVLTAGQVLCVPRAVPPFVYRTRTPTPTATGTLSSTPTVTGTLSSTPTATSSSTATTALATATSTSTSTATTALDTATNTATSTATTAPPTATNTATSTATTAPPTATNTATAVLVP
jgi:LysM repeat protein